MSFPENGLMIPRAFVTVPGGGFRFACARTSSSNRSGSARFFFFFFCIMRDATRAKNFT